MVGDRAQSVGESKERIRQMGCKGTKYEQQRSKVHCIGKEWQGKMYNKQLKGGINTVMYVCGHPQGWTGARVGTLHNRRGTVIFSL